MVKNQARNEAKWSGIMAATDKQNCEIQTGPEIALRGPCAKKPCGGVEPINKDMARIGSGTIPSGHRWCQEATW